MEFQEKFMDYLWLPTAKKKRMLDIVKVCGDTTLLKIPQ